MISEILKYNNFITEVKKPSLKFKIKSLVVFFLAVTILGGFTQNDFIFGTIKVKAAGPHDYFNALLSRTDLMKAYSLRPQSGHLSPTDPFYTYQLNGYFPGTAQDGFLRTGCVNEAAFSYLTQSASVKTSDPDPHAQDATKAIITPFSAIGGCTIEKLAQPMGASSSGVADKIFLDTTTNSAHGENTRALKIDNEIMDNRVCTIAEGGDGVRRYIATEKSICIYRGHYGTTASAHAVGAQLKISVNQLIGPMALPIYTKPQLTSGNDGTINGHKYLITWDHYWTDSYLKQWGWNNGKKTMALTSADNPDSKLFEPSFLFSCKSIPDCVPGKDIATVFVRAYNKSWTGSGSLTSWSLTDGNTMGNGTLNDSITRSGDFVIKANTWTRWWIYIDQRENDWDSFSMWVADENQNSIKVIDNALLSVSRKNPLEISSLTGRPNDGVVEWRYPEGDSNPAFGAGFDANGNPAEMVSYIRNWVVLRDPGDVSALLLRPVSGGVPPPPSTIPIIGDINLDHIVNSIDYSILNSKWFTTDTTSDLNKDGIVNAIDFSLLNANWLKTW